MINVYLGYHHIQFKCLLDQECLQRVISQSLFQQWQTQFPVLQSITGYSIICHIFMLGTISTLNTVHSFWVCTNNCAFQSRMCVQLRLHVLKYCPLDHFHRYLQSLRVLQSLKFVYQLDGI